MANMGRPKIDVDWNKFETACKLMATKEEICGILDVKDQTLQRRIKEKYDDTFEGVLKKLGSYSKISLRRNQFKMAEKNVAMAIWLGKQYLGQRDHQELELQGGFTSLVDMVSKKTKVKEKPE